MIPKKIHYIWFGNGELPEKDRRCLESWKKYCPDYEIIRWDESNYDVTKNKYMYDAYQAKKWAFVSDVARLDILYTEGGIYLDTDVELVKPIDDLLENSAFVGFEQENQIGLGLGVGSEANHKGIKKLLEIYDELSFVNPDGSYNVIPSPTMVSKTLVDCGAIMNNQMQEVIGIKLYPSEYFCPMSYSTGVITLTENTYSIHRYSMSWVDQNVKKWHMREQKIARYIGKKCAYIVVRFISFPDRVYQKVKKLGVNKTIKFAIEKIKK